MSSLKFHSLWVALYAYINVYSEIERNPRYKNYTENRIVQKIYLDWEKGRRKDEEGRRWEGK